MAGSHTNNLPTPTNLTENPSGSVIAPGIVVEVQPRRLSFEKCYHLRDKAGVLTLITPVGFVLTHKFTVVSVSLIIVRQCELARAAKARDRFHLEKIDR